ncbi:unnamed protein product [Closterium sp. NIES-54]
MCPPTDQSQPQLLPGSPLLAPAPHTEVTESLTERREPETRASTPIGARRVARPRLLAVPGTHGMALLPSSVPQRVVLPEPPASSLPHVLDPKSDLARAASPTVTRLLANVVTNPDLEFTAAFALVTELVDFAARSRLDYVVSLVTEFESICPPSVGGELALGSDVLEDRKFELECLVATLTRFASMLLCPEGDPDALDIPTPRSYAEAIVGEYSSQWQTAMDTEMASWKSTDAYIDEVPPPGVNIVDGVDFFQTFSPTPKMTTLRVLLQVPAQRDYELHSPDFSTAFLLGSLHEEIWLRRPPSFTKSCPAGTQWSLRRPVYSLRQAPREWHNTLRTTLAALGFTPSTADPSLFLRTDTSQPSFYVLVYVNDMVFATADTEALTLVKSELQKRRTCTDLGELRSYLGLQITRDRTRCTITLTQSHMVHQVLQRFAFQFSSPQPTPLSTGHSLSAPPSDESVEPSGPYLELVGCLIHRKVHWDAVKRVVRYSCSTSGMGLVLGGQGSVVLTGHSDASWADDHATQRSSQGYTFSLGSGSVSWRSTRSSSMLSSSSEAEIYVGAMAAQELRWLTYLLTDLGERPRSPQVMLLGPAPQARQPLRLTVPAATTAATAKAATAATTAPIAAPACCTAMASLRVLAFYYEGRLAHYTAVVARYSSPASAALGRLLLPYPIPELLAFATVEDLVSHLRTSDARYRATVPAEFLDRNQPPMFITLYFIHLLAAETSAVAIGAARGTPRLPFFEGCSPSPLAPSYASAAAADVGAASASAKRRTGKGKDSKGGGGGSGSGGGGSSGGGGGSGGGGSGGSGGGGGGVGGGGGGSSESGGNDGGGTGGGGIGARRGGPGGGQQQQQQRRSETSSPQQLREWLVRRGTSGGSDGCPYVIRTGVRAGQTCRKLHTQHRCFSRLDDAWCAEFGDDVELSRWADLLRSRIAIFDLDFDAILSAMYALSVSAEGDYYRCVPLDPGIAAAALGASESSTLPTVRLQLCEQFGQDLPVLRLHSGRGGEFSSNLLRDFFRGEGILQSFMLPNSPQQNGIAECRIGLVMEVTRTSMIHASAPHFLWPFADVTFDESVPFYHLFPYRSASPPPPPLFLAPGPPPVDPLPPQGPAPSGVSQVDPLSSTAPIEEAVGSGAAPGAASGGSASGGAEPGGAGSEGAASGGAESQGAWGGAEPQGAASSGGPASASLRLSPQQLCEWLVQHARLQSGAPRAGDAGAGGFGDTAGAGGLGGTSAAGPGDARTRNTVAAGTGGVGGAGAGDPTEPGAAGARGSCTGGAGAGGTGAGGAGVGGNGAGGAGGVEAGAVDPGAGDPSFESATASALVAELLDIAAACRLDYATALVAESVSASPPSVGDPDAPDIPTPRSYAEAITGPYSSQWQAAMDAEMASWKSTCTYVDEVPPPGANKVDGMWIFRTFSPTLKMTTLRVLLHIAAQRDYELHSLDFSTAFLQGSLHEEIWLRRPPGFTKSFPAGTQWSLWRPVYGLRQAPREWHDTLRTTLAALGFAPATADPSLFLRTYTSLPPFYVLVYVDNLVFTTADTEAPTLVLQRFGFQFSSPQPTPLSTGNSLSAPPSDESVEPSGPYPELVGCLMFMMTCTRPDLAYPLSLLARYVAPGRHRKVHWDAAKMVLRYLCSKSGMGLVLGGRGPVVLTSHADASWVDDSATQRSSLGNTFSLGSGFVSLRSTRSSSVLSSSCEAEIYAGTITAQELRWLTYLLTDMGEQPRSPPVPT